MSVTSPWGRAARWPAGRGRAACSGGGGIAPAPGGQAPRRARVAAAAGAPEVTVAVVAAGIEAVARARIQAAEATGPVKAPIEPDSSQAMPTRSGGAGTRRRVVRVNGSAVGRAPAARWALAAMA